MGNQQTVAGSTLLRRMVLALAMAAVVALLVMASAVPAFAVGDKGKAVERADQVGKQASGVNQPDSGNEPGRGGWDVTAKAAQADSDEGQLSKIGEIARSLNYPNTK